MISLIGTDTLRGNFIDGFNRKYLLFCDLLDNNRISDVIGLFVEFSEA